MADFDVVIIGAGAAGLAAAAELRAQNLSVCIVEARQRLGGRILTYAAPELPLPIELGAEFMHGRAPVTADWLHRSHGVMIDTPQQRWTAQQGKLLHGDALFDQMSRGLKQVRRPAKDLPFAEFLDGPARQSLTPRVRRFARTLVEGFDAADATLVSTQQTLKEWSGSGAADAPTFRPSGGYATLISGLHSAAIGPKTQLQLNSVVRRVQWQRHAVRLESEHYGDSTEITARQAIVTLPLGVLQLPDQSPGAVRFSPPLAKDSAFAGLAVGPVIKIVFRFRATFWEKCCRENCITQPSFMRPINPSRHSGLRCRLERRCWLPGRAVPKPHNCSARRRSPLSGTP